MGHLEAASHYQTCVLLWHHNAVVGGAYSVDKGCGSWIFEGNNLQRVVVSFYYEEVAIEVSVEALTYTADS